MGDPSSDNVLSILDILDIDESTVDKRLQNIMSLTSFTTEQLSRASLLLKYKLLLNEYENSDTDNDSEVEFALRLLSLQDHAFIEQTGSIVQTALLLNKKTIETKSQFMLHQLLNNLNITSILDINELDKSNVLYVLKAIDSVLQAVISSNIKICVLLIDTPVEYLLYCEDSDVRNYFMTNTVAKFVEVVDGVDILDRIWSAMIKCDVNHEKQSIIALCSLAEYYLPMPDQNGTVRYKSSLLQKRTFWIKVLFGLKSGDDFYRRCSLYLAKRAIDYLKWRKISVNVVFENNEPLFTWNVENIKSLENSWKSFFILLESLEEKQGNIVQASLALFNDIALTGKCWRDCAFQLALQHPNYGIVKTSIEYRLRYGLDSTEQASAILSALNNTDIFDNSDQSNAILQNFTKFCCDNDMHIKYIVKAFLQINWQPVPLFRMVQILDAANFGKSSLSNKEVAELMQKIFEMSCNNIMITQAVQSIIVTFMLRNKINIATLFEIISGSNFNTFKLKDNTIMNETLNRIQETTDSYGKGQQEIWKLFSNVSIMDVTLAYFNAYPGKIYEFCNSVRNKIANIQDINNRPYANKSENVMDLFYICALFEKLTEKSNPLSANVTLELQTMISRNVDSLIDYLMNSLSECCNIDQVDLYLKYIPYILHLTTSDKFQNSLSDFYPAMSNTTFHELIKCVNIDNLSIICKFKIYVVSKINAKIKKYINRDEDPEQAQLGRVRNKRNEVLSELAFNIISTNNDTTIALKVISDFIYEILDTGDEICLLWILKIFKYILPKICNKEDIGGSATNKLQPEIFLARTWKDVKEIRSNALCKPSTKEFVAILLNRSLLSKEEYHPVILDYCFQIMDYSEVSNIPLFYVVDEMMNLGNTSLCEPLLTILGDILLYGRNTCKNQRITDLIVKEIKFNKNMYFAVDFCNSNFFSDFEIRGKAINVLLQHDSLNFQGKLTSMLQKNALDLFLNKTRYHGNSRLHRILFRALQHTLLMTIVHPEGINLDCVVRDYVEILHKLPHQPSVRLCIEILVAFYITVKGIKLEKHSLEILNLNKIPATSLFMIIYMVTKHRLKNNAELDDTEYEYVMDLLLSHTMGQMFNLRLHAQFFVYELHKCAILMKRTDSTKKYEEIVKVIKNTFDGCKEEKSLIRLQSSYFVNVFDVIENLTPLCIYNTIPKLTHMDIDEILERESIVSCQECVNFIKSRNDKAVIAKYWVEKCPNDPSTSEEQSLCSLVVQDVQAEVLSASTIQKKYIPWNRMFQGDESYIINIKQNVKKSGLIIVASLIDKLPNLGGLARTCEVFGVKRYVIDSLRHLQDKNFQGLSVSAEKWVEIEEVRPGQELKTFLRKMKSKGCTLVAAEQTSNSVALQDMQFPFNTLLVLGHEKEGVPFDILPLMDMCVEVPQQGFVRSLNVHVTAAIFVWEYVRQHLI